MRSEFEFINNLKSKYRLNKIGDDCAVLPKDSETDTVITSDLLVEDIDFRFEWTTPSLLGHKALAVSLSDVAAMGANPKWALLSIGVPEHLWKTDFLDQFYAGWHSLAEIHGVELIGGDISRVPDKLVIDSTVLGDVPAGRAVMRSGAKTGDAIFVTGYLGGASAGLRLLETGFRLETNLGPEARHLLLRQLQPAAQVNSGNLLQDHGLATSMIDLSDGLSSDLFHILNASSTGARLEADLIPIDPALNAVPELSVEPRDLAIHGGEDFELLFTVDREGITEAIDLGFHRIGEVTEDIRNIEIAHDGRTARLELKGYRHF